jgi:predicted NBD/HSP70 family sugar kinase
MVVVPAKMGRLNRRTLLTRLQRLGLASRADLAKSLGMSQPTAGKIADELLELGVLEEVNGEGRETGPRQHPAKLGRPGRLLRLNRTAPRFVALQLGVSETGVSALCLAENFADEWQIRFPTPASADRWAQRLREVAPKLPRSNYWGVLVSVPGIVDEPAGQVVFSPNLHWTEKVNLSQVIQQIWHMPVVLVQEERALALGHRQLNPESQDFLLVDLGDGVGGALILSGQLYANPLPISGELGHVPVLGNTRRCGCGAVGCVETLVSTRGLVQSLAEASGGSASSWPALIEAIAGRGVAPWLAATLDATAVVIAGAINVLGMRHVVITGSLSDLPSVVMEYLSQAVRGGALWARFGQVQVEPAPRHRTAGLVAAGIDRLVLPMTNQAVTDRRLPSVSQPSGGSALVPAITSFATPL